MHPEKSRDFFVSSMMGKEVYYIVKTSCKHPVKQETASRSTAKQRESFSSNTENNEKNLYFENKDIPSLGTLESEEGTHGRGGKKVTSSV